MSGVSPEVVERAQASLGRAHEAIHATVARLLDRRGARGTLADIGCGMGDFYRLAAARFDRVIGIDAVRYPGIPDVVEWRAADLDKDPLPLADASVDVAVAIEVVEHVENPRALSRELARITKPGGHIVVTTPNQASLLSIVTLLAKQRFSAFQDSEYPAHRTALLPIDLCRMARECGLTDVETAYTEWGRVPFSGAHYPAAVAALWPRGLSDNVAVIATR